MRWKRFVVIGVLTIVILFAATYVYLNTYDYNKLKPLVARMVEEATGRKLSLGGDVNLEIGFAPKLVVTDVALANAAWGSQPQMIEIEKLQARVRLLPLLFKDVNVNYISLAGVKVLLETGPRAQGNWDFFAGSNSTGSIGLFEPSTIEVNRVSIENLHFTFHRHQAASKTQITVASLALIRQGTEDALTLDLRADYNGQPLTLTGKTGRIHNLLAHKRFPLQLSGNLANAEVEINGAIDDVLNLQGVDAKAQLTGQNFAALGPVLDIELPTTDQFEIQGHLTGSSKSLTMKNARAEARQGGLHFTANGVVQDLLTLKGMDLQSRLTGKNLEEFGEIIGEKLPATDGFEIQGRLTGSADVLPLKKVQGSARRGSMRLSLTGTVKDLLTLGGMDLQSRLTGKELAEIGPLFQTELPKLGPFDVSGKLSGSAQAFSLNKLSAKVDKSDFTGLAKFEFRKRPKITIRLESSVIDFTALMKSLEADGQKTANKSQPKGRLFSDDPLPFDVLKKVDADIVLKAKKIQARDAHLKLGHLTLKLEDSDFKIDKFEATYKQSKISGKLQIKQGSSTRVATNFLVQNFDLGAFLKDTGKNDQVRANLDIAAHLNGRGVSVHSLMAGLNGSFGVVMGEGFLTKYLDMLSSGLTQKVFQIWKPHKAVDQINCAVVQFDIKEGVAVSRAFVFDTRAGLLTGEGEINLGTEKIDFLLVPKPENPEVSLLTNLRVSGPVMNPQVSPDKISLLTEGATAISSLAVGPIGLLAPFVHLGARNAHPCNIQSAEQKGLPAPPAK